jgi:glycosyltransferase involved in cell wall biosynthesis
MLVSIITPSYNMVYSEFERSRESVSNQTNKNFEWVMVEDGEPIDRLYARSEKVKLITLSENYGPSVARNVGVATSKGNIITYLDMGDELNKDRIQHIIEIYEMYPNIEILFDSYTIVEKYDISYPYDILYYHNRFLEKRYNNGLIGELEHRNITIPLGVSHKRKPFAEVGGFQPGIVCGEDGILWRRMCNRINPENIMFSDFNSGNYYVSQTGQSRTQRRFDAGGFAFDGNRNDNGAYLDEDWFKNFSSKGLYDGN